MIMKKTVLFMVLNMCKKDDEQFNALRKNRRRLISKKTV